MVCHCLNPVQEVKVQGHHHILFLLFLARICCAPLRRRQTLPWRMLLQISSSFQLCKTIYVTLKLHSTLLHRLHQCSFQLLAYSTECLMSLQNFSENCGWNLPFKKHSKTWHTLLVHCICRWIDTTDTTENLIPCHTAVEWNCLPGCGPVSPWHGIDIHLLTRLFCWQAD